MKFAKEIKHAPFFLVGLLALNTQAATLEQALVNKAAGMQPDDKVDVIIRCQEPLNPYSVAKKDLIPALKNKANACETSLSNLLKNKKKTRPKKLWLINGIAATIPVSKLNGLKKRAGVDVVYLNEKVKLPPTPAPAGGNGNPPLTYWNLDAIRVPQLWSLGSDGAGVVVATLDTGVDAAHADIGPKWRGGSNSWFDPHGEHALPYDANGHGTQAMGLIVGGNSGGLDIGIAPGAQWIAAKIFNDQNESDLSKIHQAFQWLMDPDGNPATDDTPDIVNHSWILEDTVDECLGEFAQDIAALKAADIAVVFSAGNYGPAAWSSLSPANDAESLSVGAVDSFLTVPNFSSRGPSACDGGIYPRIVAPGKDVLTAGLTTGGINPNAYAFVTGTSFAAPHVAGAMALLKSVFPQADVYDLEEAIETSALDIEASGPENDSGSGLLDAVDAYDWLAANLGGGPGSLQLSASAFSVDENGLSLTVTVNRTGGSTGAVSIDYSTSDGAAIAGQDYQAASGTLNFADGESSLTFDINIINDSQYEGDEDFSVDLSNPQGGATLSAPQSAAVTILEDDAQPQPGDLQFSAANYSIDENGGTLTISVTRTGGSTGAVTIDYTTNDGSAIAGQDYQAASGTLSFADGEHSLTFDINIIDDGQYEGDENLHLMLSNPTGGAALGTPTNAVATIVEDDPSGPTDADGDGHAADVDCNDNDATIYPGAAESKHDGIDQDCNGYDLTIDITRARYLVSKDKIIIWATSDLGNQAALKATIHMANGNSINKNLKWKGNKNRWQKTLTKFVLNNGAAPVSVTVNGVEGAETVTVEER